jgi:hypothetical protein
VRGLWCRVGHDDHLRPVDDPDPFGQVPAGDEEGADEQVPVIPPIVSPSASQSAAHHPATITVSVTRVTATDRWRRIACSVLIRSVTGTSPGCRSGRSRPVC